MKFPHTNTMSHSRSARLSAAFASSAFVLLSAVVTQYGISSADVARLQAGTKQLGDGCTASRNGMSGSFSCPPGQSETKKNLSNQAGAAAQNAGFKKQLNQNTTRKDGCNLTTSGTDTGGSGQVTCPEGSSLKKKSSSKNR